MPNSSGPVSATRAERGTEQAVSEALPSAAGLSHFDPQATELFARLGYQVSVSVVNEFPTTRDVTRFPIRSENCVILTQVGVPDPSVEVFVLPEYQTNVAIRAEVNSFVVESILGSAAHINALTSLDAARAALPLVTDTQPRAMNGTGIPCGMHCIYLDWEIIQIGLDDQRGPYRDLVKLHGLEALGLVELLPPLQYSYYQATRDPEAAKRFVLEQANIALIVFEDKPHLGIALKGNPFSKMTVLDESAPPALRELRHLGSDAIGLQQLFKIHPNLTELLLEETNTTFLATRAEPLIQQMLRSDGFVKIDLPSDAPNWGDIAPEAHVLELETAGLNNGLALKHWATRLFPQSTVDSSAITGTRRIVAVMDHVEGGRVYAASDSRFVFILPPETSVSFVFECFDGQDQHANVRLAGLTVERDTLGRVRYHSFRPKSEVVRYEGLEASEDLVLLSFGIGREPDSREVSNDVIQALPSEINTAGKLHGIKLGAPAGNEVACVLIRLCATTGDTWRSFTAADVDGFVNIKGFTSTYAIVFDRWAELGYLTKDGDTYSIEPPFIEAVSRFRLRPERLAG